MSIRPLDDLTVVDLSHALAGPFASTLLGDYGAEIIKIETPRSGDIARGWGPPFYERDGAVAGSYFVSLHRNKKSVEIDLKHPEGRELFFRLLEKADIVLENLRVGTVDKLGIGYDAVKDRCPHIVYCSISGFGQDGPYRDRAALDLIVQAESGMISVTGPVGGPGVRCGVSVADIAAGMFAAFGIMTAIHARRRTGRGQFVDVSMLQGQLSLLHGVIGAHLADGVVPAPMGTAYASLLPYQTFKTRSKDLALGVGSDKLWRLLCPILGLDSFADDPRFATNAARNANRALVIESLQAAFLEKTYEEWEPQLLAAGIPVGAINTIEQVVAHPQVAARQALVACDHPVAGPARLVAPPVRLSETPGDIRTPAPLLGQHTVDVLRERLGLDDSEIARLHTRSVIGS
ncbi:MAG TPA: CoA transferase [Vicinamibacterales bacterium]|jgi:crotonobetainyl-CoA:carnitine CoA-transferase CaiB-like acyl-CoA transferase|nr:CoA transferase [Vicinamibacterales bacterium]